MTANTSPIYTITPTINWSKNTTASTTTDGTGANDLVADTAGTNGHFLQKVMMQPISTSGSTTTNAAAARFYINNGSSAGTAANNVMFKEVSLAAIAVNTAATAAAIGYEVPINFQMPNGYKLIIGITSFASSTQWNCVSIGGDY